MLRQRLLMTCRRHERRLTGQSAPRCSLVGSVYNHDYAVLSSFVLRRLLQFCQLPGSLRRYTDRIERVIRDGRAMRSH